MPHTSQANNSSILDAFYNVIKNRAPDSDLKKEIKFIKDKLSSFTEIASCKTVGKLTHVLFEALEKKYKGKREEDAKFKPLFNYGLALINQNSLSLFTNYWLVFSFKRMGVLFTRFRPKDTDIREKTSLILDRIFSDQQLTDFSLFELTMLAWGIGKMAEGHIIQDVCKIRERLTLVLKRLKEGYLKNPHDPHLEENFSYFFWGLGKYVGTDPLILDYEINKCIEDLLELFSNIKQVKLQKAATILSALGECLNRTSFKLMIETKIIDNILIKVGRRLSKEQIINQDAVQIVKAIEKYLSSHSSSLSKESQEVVQTILEELKRDSGGFKDPTAYQIISSLAKSTFINTFGSSESLVKTILTNLSNGQGKPNNEIIAKTLIHFSEWAQATKFRLDQSTQNKLIALLKLYFNQRDQIKFGSLIDLANGLAHAVSALGSFLTQDSHYYIQKLFSSLAASKEQFSESDFNTVFFSLGIFNRTGKIKYSEKLDKVINILLKKLLSFESLTNHKHLIIAAFSEIRIFILENPFDFPETVQALVNAFFEHFKAPKELQNESIPCLLSSLSNCIVVKKLELRPEWIKMFRSIYLEVDLEKYKDTKEQFLYLKSLEQLLKYGLFTLDEDFLNKIKTLAQYVVKETTVKELLISLKNLEKNRNHISIEPLENFTKDHSIEIEPLLKIGIDKDQLKEAHYPISHEILELNEKTLSKVMEVEFEPSREEVREHTDEMQIEYSKKSEAVEEEELFEIYHENSIFEEFNQPTAEYEQLIKGPAPEQLVKQIEERKESDINDKTESSIKNPLRTVHMSECVKLYSYGNWDTHQDKNFPKADFGSSVISLLPEDDNEVLPFFEPALKAMEAFAKANNKHGALVLGLNRKHGTMDEIKLANFAENLLKKCKTDRVRVIIKGFTWELTKEQQVRNPFPYGTCKSFPFQELVSKYLVDVSHGNMVLILDADTKIFDKTLNAIKATPVSAGSLGSIYADPKLAEASRADLYVRSHLGQETYPIEHCFYLKDDGLKAVQNQIKALYQQKLHLNSPIDTSFPMNFGAKEMPRCVYFLNASGIETSFLKTEEGATPINEGAPKGKDFSGKKDTPEARFKSLFTLPYSCLSPHNFCHNVVDRHGWENVFWLLKVANLVHFPRLYNAGLTNQAHMDAWISMAFAIFHSPASDSISIEERAQAFMQGENRHHYKLILICSRLCLPKKKRGKIKMEQRVC